MEQQQPQQPLPADQPPSASDAAAQPQHMDQTAVDPTTGAAHLGNDFSHQAALMQSQQLMADPSMMGYMTMPMTMPNGQVMMPMMPANGAPHDLSHQNGISADDLALYDRQIRLWGVAAQAKIQSANILLITLKALANEVAKNLVLAGVGSLTVLDDAPVSEADLGAQFFLPEGENLIGQNRAQAACPAIQKLNPRVHVHADPGGVKSKGPSYFAAFDIVIATDLDPDSFNLINTATRINGKPFYAASSHGMYGFIFSDLIEHDFVIERDVGNVPARAGTKESRTRSITDVRTTRDGPRNVECVTKRELYSTWFLASDAAVLPEEYTRSSRRLRSVSPALSCLRALWEFGQLEGGRAPSNREDLKQFTQIATQKHRALSLPSETLTPEFLRSFLQNLGSEIAPVAAVLGGQLAQDVINVLGQKEQPIQNMVIFDGNTMEALMYALHPEGELGSGLLSMSNGPMGTNGGPPAGSGDMMMSAGAGLDTSMGGTGMPQPGVSAGGPGTTTAADATTAPETTAPTDTPSQQPGAEGPASGAARPATATEEQGKPETSTQEEGPADGPKEP